MTQPSPPIESQRPPDPPELPEGVDPAPPWPAWFAPVAFVTAFGVTLVSVAILGVIVALARGDVADDSPTVVIVGTLLQGTALIATAIWFASLRGRPRAWQFGLRETRLWPAVGWAALGMVCFYVFAIVYVALFDPQGEQTVVEDLGGDEGAVGMVLAALVVIVVAPVAEEFFFRGFFYRALRSRFGVLAAASIDGAVFGVIHFTGSDTLSLLPVLALLGLMFCLVYERTGSLYPVIALHAINNALAYSGEADGAVVVSILLGAAMIAGCAIVPRMVSRRGAATTPGAA